MSRSTSQMQMLERRLLLAVQPVLVKDINSSGDGSPAELVEVNGTLFFTASTASNGTELWKSDGTASGTVMVKDIKPGAGGSEPTGLTNVNGVLFFSADNGSAGRELWKSDGTASGTVQVKDIRSGPESSNLPTDMINVNGTLFFALGTNGLWKSDGTEAGTVLVSSADFSYLGDPTVVNGTLFFSNYSVGGDELWTSDGTVEGTLMVKDIFPGTHTEYDHSRGYSYEVSNSSYPSGLTSFNGTLYFSAVDATNGRELWKSDGTDEGTVRVKDIEAGADSSFPSGLTSFKGALFFTANGALWKSDGTEAGTVVVAHEGSFGFAPTIVSGLLFFASGETLDGTVGRELWKSDGTASGTVMVKDIYPGTHLTSDQDGNLYSVPNNSNPGDLINIDGTLYFTAADASHGRELWKSDGTAAGTVLVKDIRTGPNGSEPSSLAYVRGTLFFAAADELKGKELWKVAAAGGVLGVSGTPGGDDIVVTVSGSNIQSQRNGVLIDSVALADVTRVEISSGDGDDDIDCSAIALPSSVDAGDGNDHVAGGTGNDTFLGGAGNNDLFGGDGNDRIFAGAGADTIRGWNGDDIIDAGGGNDWVIGGDGGDKVAAGDGDDTVSGGAQKDTIDGGLGSDRLNGNGGHDRLYGYAGADRLYGYDGNDYLDGGSSNDRLEGGGGLDSMFGQGGNDRFFAADTEVDQLFGGKDSDTGLIDAADVLASIETQQVSG